MPEQTRDTLKKLALALRKAGGLGDAPAPAAAPSPSAPVPKPSPPGPQPAPQAPAAVPSKQGALDPSTDRLNGVTPASASPNAAAPPPRSNPAANFGEAPHRGVP